MRKLTIDKAVLQEFKGLPRQQYRPIVSAILDLLADPAPYHSKSLEGTAYRSIAVGHYRVIYRHDEDLVHIVVAGKRNGVGNMGGQGVAYHTHPDGEMTVDASYQRSPLSNPIGHLVDIPGIRS
jgi:mRNA-degrading endonuclease RelE of RelBE toxin-antitoxin system